VPDAEGEYATKAACEEDEAPSSTLLYKYDFIKGVCNSATDGTYTSESACLNAQSFPVGYDPKKLVPNQAGTGCTGMGGGSIINEVSDCYRKCQEWGNKNGKECKSWHTLNTNDARGLYCELSCATTSSNAPTNVTYTDYNFYRMD